MRTLALDVGNTSVAAALFEGPAESEESVESSVTRHEVRGVDPVADLAAWVGFASAQRADRIVVGSVHRFGAALAAALAADRTTPVRHFADGSDFPIALDGVDRAQVGVDRLAAALAAATLSGSGALVVSAGTAITVDWVDASRTFRGGAIVPGRRLQSRALHQFTDRLPQIELWNESTPLPLPGRDTRSAIRSGLDHGIPGMVVALLEGLARAAGPLPIFVTGGDAGWLAARLGTYGDPSRPGLAPFLVARGLALALQAPTR